MAAPGKAQAEKPVSTPREYGLPLESESMRVLQQAVAAAQQAMAGAEQITARASRIEDAINAIARTRQAVAAAQERAVAAAQEQVLRAIAGAEAGLSRLGEPAAAAAPAQPVQNAVAETPPPAEDITTQEQAAVAAQQYADRAIAAAEEAVGAIGRDTQATITSFDQQNLDDLPQARRAMQLAVAAQEQALATAQEQVGLALTATEIRVQPPQNPASAKNG